MVALCRGVCAAWHVADDEAAAGPDVVEDDARAFWPVLDDEDAAGPDVDEDDARALWPVVDDEDAAGPVADEEDASATITLCRVPAFRKDCRTKSGRRRCRLTLSALSVPCHGPIVSHPPTQGSATWRIAMVALLLRRAHIAAVARSTGRYPPCNKVYHTEDAPTRTPRNFEKSCVNEQPNRKARGKQLALVSWVLKLGLLSNIWWQDRPR